MQEQNEKTIPQNLREILLSIKKAALAFSGGVDSSYLLYAAIACGLDVRAYYADSQFQPQFELRDAKRLAGELSADLSILPLDVLQNPILTANPSDRCYHCKKVIFACIAARAREDGYPILLDGSNASDDATFRPGMRALTEMGVRSPLREAGLAKADVRRYAHEAGLFTWDKPAYACLATRIPSDTAITADLLKRIEHAEDALFSMGFADFRVRIFEGAAKLELPASQLIEAAGRHAELTRALSPWFHEVLLNLNPR